MCPGRTSRQTAGPLVLFGIGVPTTRPLARWAGQENGWAFGPNNDVGNRCLLKSDSGKSLCVTTYEISRTTRPNG